MKNDHLYMSIKEADNISLRNGAANRIVQLLQKQRYSNNENSAKRWVWELCQNAKDVCNSSGKVKISIDFDEQNGKISFRHNGKAFSMSNVLALINQSSSKDRNDGSERKSGKFGTGFITTHLLSEIVNVSGILETDSEYSKFNITLDRTGNEKNEIMAAMEKAVNDLQSCIPINASDFDADEFNTEFEYKIDEYSIQVARDGLENLRISAPFVLAMLQDIEEISIESTREKYRYKQDISCHLENSTVSEIIYEGEGCLQSIYVLKLFEGNVSVLIALEHKDSSMKIMPFSEQQSKLFCDFPLIGTEDFPFPILISSRDFNPTEPRDGVFLVCKNKSRVDSEIEENRQIIETACNLYQQLLEYAARKKWNGIYNITKVGSYDKKEWYDKEWLEGIVDKCKDTILHTPIIHSANGSMVELLDCWDDAQTYIISDKSEEIRDKIWQLMNYIMPDSIPRKEDLHEWYYSLWSNCNRYSFKSLTKQINEYGNVDTLSAKIAGIEWQEWLMDYFELIDTNKEWQDYVGSNAINILPNQKGTLCAIGELYFDVDVLDEYKNILNELGDDSMAWLLHLDFERKEWFNSEEYYNEDILKHIEEQLEKADREIKQHVLLKITFMYDKEYSDLHVQRQICNYVTKILGLELQMIQMDAVSENLLQEALKYSITMVADRISKCNTVNGLAEYLNITSDEAVELLAEFIEFAVKKGYDNLVNKETKPILPNQNGKFTSKENLFLDDEIDNVLKDLAYQAGVDIREELLMKEVFLELPNNRQKRNADIAQCIVQYVDTNRNSKDESVRSNFKKLLIWIMDNKDKSKVLFLNLYKNKHYLYDDEEIASNIKQAETLSVLMDKYDIDTMDKLEQIIENKTNIQQNVNALTKEDITEDVLIQYGIDSDEALDKAFLNKDFAERYIRKTKYDTVTYEYVIKILARAKKNILSYLESQEEYNLSEVQEIANTICVVKKEGKQIYVLARPSDGGEVRIYYRTEMDILDYSMDWELWVENGRNVPQKITFGKIIKLTGLNRIPLKGM